MLGLMMPTWFLSMWISNTATTAMMVPIANAILLQLKDVDKNLEKGRIKLGKFGRSAKFGQRPCLFHILIIEI